MFDYNVEVMDTPKRKDRPIVISNEFGWVAYDVEDAKSLVAEINSAVMKVEKRIYLSKIKK